MHEGGNLRRSERPPSRHFDVLEPFTKHRRFNAPISRELGKDLETAWLAKRIGNCSSRLSLEIEVPEVGDPVAHLKGARSAMRVSAPSVSGGGPRHGDGA